MQLDALLARLDNVRKFGDGWRANCPIGHKSRGALAITEANNKSILLHCFAGCSAGEIVAAVGMEVADLFPVRLVPQTPEQRRATRQAFKETAWPAALGVLAREATLLLVAAGMFERREQLAGDDIERVRLAAQRIHNARGVLV